MLRQLTRITGPLVVGLAVAGAGSVQAQVPAACADRTISPDHGILTGTAVDSASGIPLQKVGVEVSWREDGRRTQPLEVDTDSLGHFVFCQVFAGTQLRVQGRYLGQTATELALVEAGQVEDMELRMATEGRLVTGQVLLGDSQDPVADAVIRLTGTPVETVSDENGRFRFQRLPPGNYNLVARHISHEDLATGFAVNTDEALDITLRMSDEPIRLDPVIVDVRKQRLAEVGFYDRRERGRGVYMTRAQIEAKQPSMASDALRGIAGLTLMPSNWGPYQDVTGRGGCPFRYFVNGGRAGDDFYIDELAQDWIEAIEIYRGPSSVPPQYIPALGSGNSACGVILVWLTNAAHDFRRN
ncbi:MAG: TonB-dependent receptor [Gemmatimonadota bacterium]